ncbi:MAG TPA: sterol-binding protein [Gammaproteobacteria bacterium]|nr:sterol-binding protein [Gammaproteobacteria bacterium]
MTSTTPLAAALETALNLYLKQDPLALQRCAKLDGKVIAVDITDLGLSLYFLPGSNGVLVAGHYEGDADTRLRGSLPGFVRLTLGSREDALFKGAVEIQGDTDTGHQFQAILSGVDWDWEEQLSRVTGDLLAHQAGSLVRKAKHFIKSSQATLQQDLSEYLQEEARILPTAIEVRYFLDDVDRLRADVDRLAARLDRLHRAEADNS